MSKTPTISSPTQLLLHTTRPATSPWTRTLSTLDAHPPELDNFRPQSRLLRADAHCAGLSRGVQLQAIHQRGVSPHPVHQTRSCVANCSFTSSAASCKLHSGQPRYATHGRGRRAYLVHVLDAEPGYLVAVARQTARPRSSLGAV
jgi:hypothetical protein